MFTIQLLIQHKQKDLVKLHLALVIENKFYRKNQ
jgi:hypothetical protein